MRFIAAAVVLFCFALSASAKPLDVKSLGEVPVLIGGRVKPLQTVAREMVAEITGREGFGIVASVEGGGQKLTEKMDPLSLMLDWAAHPEQWENRPVIAANLFEVHEKLKMGRTAKWIAPASLRRNAEFRTITADINRRRQEAGQFREKVKLSRLEQEMSNIDERLDNFDATVKLNHYIVLPVQGNKAWASIGEMKQTGDQLDAGYRPVLASWDAVLSAYKAGDQSAFDDAVKQFRSAIESIAGKDYFDRAAVGRELFYNKLQPFRLSWIIYLCGAIVVVGSLLIRHPAIYWTGIVVFIVAFVLSLVGFAMRSSIKGWLAVTNFYESFIWVAIAGALIALILEMIHRTKIMAIAGAVVAALAMLASDYMSMEYGRGISNPMPVLRSQFWLTVHVLTIVSSYGAFALAVVLGNLVLGQLMRHDESNEVVRNNLAFTYRSLQVGLVLCAAGTLTGAFWADQSWGRFWGWDPKETWSLIIVLVYAGLLHARYIRWIGSWGLAAGSVICFTAVLIAWYGVNYLFGEGLHSYGGGQARGEVYVGIFCLIQWAFTIIAWVGYRRRLANPPAKPFPVVRPVK